jgi:hypothetical protein
MRGQITHLSVRLAVGLIVLQSGMFAQGRGAAPAAATAKAAALQDITGYWVSIVTEDWRFRMVTPAKGDYASIPLNPEGRKAADTWDPDKDIAAREQCRSYGAPAIMRVPGRIHISWQDDNTLKIETDSGQQTRLLHFNAQPPAAEPASLQGYSVATWDTPPAVVANGGGRAPAAARIGSLKVVTTHLKPGYLRKNGVPYSANTVLTEYFTRTDEPDGTSWLIITNEVVDPAYLQQPFITSSNFRLQHDAAGWMPAPCEAK